MSRARRMLPNALMFAVALAFSLPAWAAYDAFITVITGNTVSVRKAGGEQVSIQILDPTALRRLAVGQKLTVDEATGKASMQDFHFTIRHDSSSPKMMMMPAPTAPPAGPRQVMINGRLLTGNAKVVGGKVFIPLEDFARALGGNGITLNSSLKLQFPTLSSIGGAGASPAYKVQSNAAYKENVGYKENVAYKESVAQKVAPAPLKIGVAGQVKMGDGSVRGLQVLSLNRTGVISSQLQRFDGKVFVPLNDILIGLGQHPGGANMNSMSLNFTVPAGQRSIIGVL